MTFANAEPLALVMLGLMLGIRHATDPDHVIAVTAILTRERRLGGAARIGFVWGLGHTLTVLLVGVAIIIFKLKVPLRLGLSMEFAVAVVLILLGLEAAGPVRVVGREHGALRPRLRGSRPCRRRRRIRGSGRDGAGTASHARG